MNKKEKEQLLKLLKDGISLCLPSKDYSSLHLMVDKVITKPENIKLIRKWISED